MIFRLSLAALLVAWTGAAAQDPPRAKPFGFEKLRLTSVQLGEMERVVAERRDRKAFDACRKVLTPEQDAAWLEVAMYRMAVPPNWLKLKIVRAQKAQMAPTYVFYRFQADQRLAEIRQGRRRATDDDVNELRMLTASMLGEMRSVLTAGQEKRLKALESSDLLPRPYSEMGMTDDQLVALHPALNRLMPEIEAVFSQMSREHQRFLREESYVKDRFRRANDAIRGGALTPELFERMVQDSRDSAVRKSNQKLSRAELTAEFERLRKEINDACQAVMTADQKEKLAKRP